MANVRKLMRLAREYERDEGRDLGGFLALAAESTRRDEREGMAAVQPEGHDGVRVMTVHAAKGLEFPVVAGSRPCRGRAAGPPRLAATRACERLIMSSSFRPAQLEPLEELGVRDGAIRMILPALAKHGWSGGE